MPTTGLADQPSAIPPPANFPIAWARPEDETLFWMHNRMHFPRPITLMTHEIMRLFFEDGIEAAGHAYDVPLRCRAARFNTYFYIALTAAPPSPDARPEETLEAAMVGLDSRWREELLPEIQRHLAFWDGFDLAAASISALA